MTEWISVKDKLPDIDKTVLLRLKYDNNPFIGQRTEKGWNAQFPDMGEIIGNAYYKGDFKDEPKIGIEITHWYLWEKIPEDIK